MEWKTIPGYEEYEVSDTGIVVSNIRYVFSKKEEKAIPHKRKKVLSQYKSKTGYMCVGIGSKTIGNKKVAKVHRLVASAFIPNPLNLPEVNHKDGDKTNNNVKNLEWVTASENVKHAYESGIQPKSEKRKKLFLKNRKENSIPVMVVNPCGKVEKFNSMQELANKLGVNRSSVSKACKKGGTVKGCRVFYDKERPRCEITIAPMLEVDDNAQQICKR